MMNKKKKGFSLIELVVVIAILAIFGAVLVPSVINSMNDGKEKSDEAFASQLVKVVETGSQQSKTYYQLSRVFESQTQTHEGVTLIFESDFEGNFEYKDFLVEPLNTTNEEEVEEVNQYATKYNQMILDYINGSIKMEKIQSEKYRKHNFYVHVFPTERDYKVQVTSEWIEQEEPTTPTE